MYHTASWWLTTSVYIAQQTQAIWNHRKITEWPKMPNHLFNHLTYQWLPATRWHGCFFQFSYVPFLANKKVTPTLIRLCCSLWQFIYIRDLVAVHWLYLGARLCVCRYWGIWAWTCLCRLYFLDTSQINSCDDYTCHIVACNVFFTNSVTSPIDTSCQLYVLGGPCQLVACMTAVLNTNLLRTMEKDEGCFQ